MQAVKGALGKYLYITIAVLCVLLLGVAVFCYVSTTAKNVELVDGENVFSVKLYGNATVADAIIKNNITLTPFDSVDKDLDELLQNEDTVTIHRQALSYSSGGSVNALVSLGENMLADSNAIHLQQLQAAQQQSSFSASGASGTSSLVGNTLVCYDGTYTIAEVVTVKATGYCACSICCGEYASGYTADGSLATAGHTLATPSIYPFGTKIFLPYFDRVFEVEDRGGAIEGNRIDVYFDTHEEALRFGVRTFEAYILQ